MISRFLTHQCSLRNSTIYVIKNNPTHKKLNPKVISWNISSFLFKFWDIVHILVLYSSKLLLPDSSDNINSSHFCGTNNIYNAYPLHCGELDGNNQPSETDIGEFNKKEERDGFCEIETHCLGQNNLEKCSNLKDKYMCSNDTECYWDAEKRNCENKNCENVFSKNECDGMEHCQYTEEMALSCEDKN